MTISARDGSPQALPAAEIQDEPHGGRLSDILRAVAADQTRERVSVTPVRLADSLRQFFRLSEVLLDDWQRRLGELLQGSIVTSFCVRIE